MGGGPGGWHRACARVGGGMKGDPFLAFVAFQREVLSFQQRNLDLMQRAIDAGEDVAEFQQKAHDAAMAGAKAWTAWVSLWVPKK